MVLQGALNKFLKLESSAGLLVMGAAALALLVSNSPLGAIYDDFWRTRVGFVFADFQLVKPLLMWVNDGLMAVFFLLVGLEIKREFLTGELASLQQRILPFAGAVGGIVLPALVYSYWTGADPIALRGWAIPAATDIAFSLAVLALFAARVPLALKVLLTAIAVIDDLAAIVIIALFYTEDLSARMLAVAAIVVLVMLILNRASVMRPGAYLLLGVVLWVSVLKSGVHATLAGVITAFALPLRPDKGNAPAPASLIEDLLHPWVAYGVLPLFALANAGLDLGALQSAELPAGVATGAATGLVVGKSLGIFLALIIVNALMPVTKRSAIPVLQLLALSAVAGIGFTMSLFIASLAFETAPAQYFEAAKAGVLAGSLLAGALGALLLHWALPRR